SCSSSAPAGASPGPCSDAPTTCSSRSAACRSGTTSRSAALPPSSLTVCVATARSNGSCPMNPIDRIEAEQLRKELPPFKPGDTVRVHVRVVEGDKERIQVFEGTVIGRKGGASRETFTVRKTSYGVGVERTFPVHSP